MQDTLASALSSLLAHPSYGVRFEAAVALASLGSALPWCAAGLLRQVRAVDEKETTEFLFSQVAVCSCLLAVLDPRKEGQVYDHGRCEGEQCLGERLRFVPPSDDAAKSGALAFFFSQIYTDYFSDGVDNFFVDICPDFFEHVFWTVWTIFVRYVS